MNNEKQNIIPELRFPEFENDGDWLIKPLKKVFSIFQGYSFSSKDSVDKGTRWLKIADVSIQKMNHNNPSFLPVEYIKEYDKFSLKKGDYVLALTRPILNGKLKISVVDDLYHNSLLNQRVGKLISSENLELVYYLLQTHYLIGEIEKSIAGSEPPNLSMKQIENIQIAIPKNPKEQQKIANCLFSLDEAITAETEKLDHLKDHKKGLLQQLFPAEGETQPKFRFPEFENDGDWEQKEIGKLFKFKQGVQVPIDNQYQIKEDGMVRFIRIIDITGNSEPPRYISNPGADHIIKKDDLFMIRYGTPGAISIGFEGVIANNLFRLIWKSSNSINTLFWYYAFQKIEKKIFSLSGSSSMPAISFSTLDNLDIAFPKEPEEQQKIAQCLSSVDELIESQTQEVKALKKHKKGLMQQLFPNVNELAI